QIFDEKSKELQRILIEKIDKQKIEINLVRDTITKLNEEAEASQHDLDLIKTKISRLHENLTSIEQISFKIHTYPLTVDDNAVQIEEKKDLQTILSSPFKTIDFADLSSTSLFLTTDTVGSSIIEFCLLPTVELSRQWKSPDTCTKDEYINRIRYSHETLGLVIQNLTKNTLKIELRCSKTLDRFWSIPLNSGLKLTQCEYCAFNDCQWLFIDKISSSILHITNDEKIKRTCNYNSKLCNVALFGTGILAVLTDKCINFHKL
ncbi:unnamed protein product, partial [Rotaria magnacalcarata]